MSELPQPETLFEGRFIRAVRRGHWEYVERVREITAVMIVAVTPDDCLLLAEQFRVPVAGRVLELPAGLAGDVPGEEDEALELAARRELMEETGYEAETMIPVTAGPSSPGLANEVVTIFLAQGLHKVHDGGGDDHENIVVHAVPLDGIELWLEDRAAEGVMIEPRIYAGIYFARRSPILPE
jgi:ADP-ribose pyrophosphatase